MSEWQDISTAPRDGAPFIALNHDCEVWVARYGERGRLMFRTNELWEPRRFEHVSVNGETLLREDEEFARANERWENHWTIWTRLYEFKPTHWMPLPNPPLSPSNDQKGAT